MVLYNLLTDLLTDLMMYMDVCNVFQWFSMISNVVVQFADRFADNRFDDLYGVAMLFNGVL